MPGVGEVNHFERRSDGPAIGIDVTSPNTLKTVAFGNKIESPPVRRPSGLVIIRSVRHCCHFVGSAVGRRRDWSQIDTPVEIFGNAMKDYPPAVGRESSRVLLQVVGSLNIRK